MITSVELENFLSHSSTKLDFDDGVTVFVGDNGSGKSSVIDAITFALFGQHTRKSKKGLIRRGQSQGYAKINFTVNGKSYQAERKIDNKGTLSAKFSEKKDDKWIAIAAGERKQFGESMTKEVESKLGLDFEKLKVASIVQQGELNSIIKAKPKEFKELLNAVVGIDKLDKASELGRILQRNFRETIQKRCGYDDTHIEILEKESQTIKHEIKEADPIKKELESRKENNEKELSSIQERLGKESPKEAKLVELEARKTDLINYAKGAISAIQNEISENERKIKDCEGCFEFVETKKETEKRLEKIESEIESINNKVHENSINIVKLEEQESLAQKLELKGDRCPVCDSKVDHLNPLFQVEHLNEEKNSLQQNIKSLEKQKEEFDKERFDFSDILKKAIKAETTLQAHSISDSEDLNLIKQKITSQKNNLQKIPGIFDSGKLVKVSVLDSHTKMLYEKIVELEGETKGFDPQEFIKLKDSLEQKRRELSEIDQKFGAIIQKIKEGEIRIRKISSALEELKLVRGYISNLEEINNNIFNRDGPVATSLRSWALNTISEKASEYLVMLNTKIQRISLSEKARDVTISCYSGNSVLDVDSLSGGEQVSIALALRLGMSHLLGASNLNFVILDEPTTHLDQERRRSLVSVFSQISNLTEMTSKAPLQFIIITHDAEIFENSKVDRIYQFSATPQGTQVIKV